MNDASISKIVVFLIHGTWAPEAPWTEDDSLFVSCLKSHLHHVPTEFRRFSWSGRNTHTHRLNATKKLRAELSQSLEENKGSPHFIVGHSHGGSIACYALQRDDLRDAISGVICLGTPFLHVQKNRLPRSLLGAALITILLFSAATIFYAITLPQDPLTKWLVAATILLLCPVFLLLLISLLKGRGEWFSLRSLWDFRSDPSSYIEALSFPPLRQEQFIAVRITGDEASGALVTSQFFVWLFRTMWARLTPVYEFIERYRKILGRLFGFILIAIAAITWLGVNLGETLGFVTDVFLIIFIIISLIMFVFGFLAYLMLGLMFLMHLPIGIDAILASFNVQTTAEPSPPGRASIYHITPCDAADARSNGLRHSEIYEDVRVIDFVGDWILARLREGGPFPELER